MAEEGPSHCSAGPWKKVLIKNVTEKSMRDAASSEEPQSNMLELSTHNRTVQVTAGSDFRMLILWPKNIFVCLRYIFPQKSSLK